MDSYIVRKLVNGRYILCKVLNEYDTEKEANADMVKIATGKTTEKELLRRYDIQKR